MQKSFLAKPEILILRKKLQRFLSTVTLQELCTIGNNCLLILNALLMACLNIAIITFCSRHLQIYTLSTSVSKTTTSHSYSSCKIHIVQLPQLVPLRRTRFCVKYSSQDFRSPFERKQEGVPSSPFSDESTLLWVSLLSFR